MELLTFIIMKMEEKEMTIYVFFHWKLGIRTVMGTGRWGDEELGVLEIGGGLKWRLENRKTEKTRSRRGFG